VRDTRQLPGTNDTKTQAVRVLVGNELRSYRDVYAHAFRTLRPDLEVREVEPGDLDREIERFEPHVVVCSHASTLVRESVLAWIELYPEGAPVAMICTAGELSSIRDVQLDNLISVIDQTIELLNPDEDSPG
jgi:hypothetical protein